MKHVQLRDCLRWHWPDYAVGVGLLLVTNLLGASIPLSVKAVLDFVAEGRVPSAWPLLGQILLVVAVMFAVRVGSRYALIGVGRKNEYVVRRSLYAHLLAMPKSFYDARQTGDLMSRLTNDLTAFRMMTGGAVMLLANVLFAYMTVLPMMARMSIPLTLIAFILYPMIIGLMRMLAGRVKNHSHDVQDRLGDLTAIAQENFSGIGVIQSYAKEPQESRRFADASHQYLQANTRLVKVRSLLYVLIAVVSGLSLLAVLSEGGREVMTRQMSVTSLAAFMLYLERLAWPTVSLGWILSSFQQGLAAKERINEILATPVVVNDEQADAHLTAFPEGPISVRDLTFAYDNPYAQATDDTANLSQKKLSPVLQEVSFTINPGERVAIVGPIGSGKSTLLNLLVRFYPAPAGRIFYADTPIEAIPLSLLRDAVTLMPQHHFLFSASIEDNLAYMAPELRGEPVVASAQTAQIHGEIQTFGEGYATMVGERGVTLSGGQRQRSTLARTLLLEPRVLLLDDPFSSVDVSVEAAIIEALNARHQQSSHTTIVATQRFAWVATADKVIVLSPEGRVEAVGTHSSLMLTCPLYQSLSQQAAVQTEGLLS